MTEEQILSFVDLVEWAEMLDAHPVDVAQEIEREIDAELPYPDGRTPEQDTHIKEKFGGVSVTTSAEWRRRHL